MNLKNNIFILTFIVLSLINPAYSYAAYIIESKSSEDRSIYEIKRDYRISSLTKYLETYNSPLAIYAKDFVIEADTNKIDWRLVAAISGVESTFGKFLPKDSFNAWGWGIYGDNTFSFSSYNEAIKTISKSLREDYINKWGAKDIYQIGKIYAASPTWAQRVERIMEKIDQFSQKNTTDTLSISL